MGDIPSPAPHFPERSLEGPPPLGKEGVPFALRKTVDPPVGRNYEIGVWVLMGVNREKPGLQKKCGWGAAEGRGIESEILFGVWRTGPSARATAGKRGCAPPPDDGRGEGPHRPSPPPFRGRGLHTIGHGGAVRVEGGAVAADVAARPDLLPALGARETGAAEGRGGGVEEKGWRRRGGAAKDDRKHRCTGGGETDEMTRRETPTTLALRLTRPPLRSIQVYEWSCN